VWDVGGAGLPVIGSEEAEFHPSVVAAVAWGGGTRVAVSFPPLCARVCVLWTQYYNMVSLIWKGAQLEGAMGSVRFAVMVAFLLVASSITVVATSFFAADLLGYPDLLRECSVGFSAVSASPSPGPRTRWAAAAGVGTATLHVARVSPAGTLGVAPPPPRALAHRCCLA
jgi:hypothetical protein